MINFIKGFLAHKEADFIVIETSGLGYQIYVPEDLFYRIGNTGDQIKLFTHLIHKEDLLELYGFENINTREVFRYLISVSGIGSKIALKILSILNYKNIITAVLNKDSITLSRVNGLGKKKAEKMIIELENKFKKRYQNFIAEKSSIKYLDQMAIDALISLGYKEQKSLEAVKNAMKKKDIQSTEEIIKEALKKLAKL